MCHVPGREVAVLCAVLAQRRKHDAVLEGHPADLEGLEELGNGGIVGLRVEGSSRRGFLGGGEVGDLNSCMSVDVLDAF